MNIERIQLDFNKRKYDALEQSFSRMSQGSVITELEKYLDFLYEKNVPVSEREEIETNSCQEHLAYRAMIAPGKKFSVITLNNADGRISFSSEGLLTFLDIANVYREKVRDWVDITNLETIRTFFGENDLLDPLSFLLFVKRLEYNPSVTMLADFDFEKDTIRVLKSGNTEWSAYRLKDVASAAFLAYQKPELHLSERRKLFEIPLRQRNPEPKVSRFWRVVNRALCTKRNRPNKSGVKQEKGATLFGSAAPVHSGRQRRPQAVFELSLCNILTFNVF